jgi:long-chain fatty acid transport protein
MKLLHQSIAILLMFSSLAVFGGGIVTNTNQSASWVRMFARDASRDLDAVYYNPAGVTGLGSGLFLSLNNQTLLSTRKITNDYSYLNSSEYKGNISAPVFPGFYGVYGFGKLSLTVGFNPVGGGGNATYKKGLPSFELAVSDLVPTLASRGVTGYSSNVYFKGSSVFYGYQAGAAYKINNMLSVFAGARYVYAVNTYQGSLNNNMVIIGDVSASASTFLTGLAAQATSGAASASGAAASMQPLVSAVGGLTLDAALAAGIITATQKATFEGGLQQLTGSAPAAGMTIEQIQAAYASAATSLTATAKNATAKSGLLQDQSADVTQTGKGITPILGVNINLMEDKLNIGLKYEFLTKIKLKNKTASDITTGFASDGTPITQFPDGAETSSDMPALLTIGVSYKVLPKLKTSAGFRYYFDKDADYGRSQNGILVRNSDVIASNNYEVALGAEYNITDKFLVSAGYLLAKTGVMVGYNTDLSSSLSSNSIGAGCKYDINKRFAVNLGMSYTKYVQSEQNFIHTIPSSIPTTISVNEKYNKDVFIVGVGVDFKLVK